ncbi:uncharacterized protein V1513DRAFT_477049 [Lipomyces chichibuensis]|uniref:uncharacterized protein n=1 Tax=Lipomyces chichibuensis TaxID=1546026 RepID=UPI00334366F3
MPKKNTASLQELLEKLTVHAQNDEHTFVLDLANRLLRQDPTDIKAKRAKQVALIKLDRYSEALEVFGDDELKPSELALERAYCLYRLGKLEVAKDMTESAIRSGESSVTEHRGLLHLKAQIAYRLENFADAKETYDELSKGSYLVDGEDHDVVVNILAIQAQQRWWNFASAPAPNTTVVSHEQAFNMASLKMGERQYGDALSLLKQAKELAQALEGLSEKELQDELYPILIQAAYVHILLGEKDEAAEILSGFDAPSISEPLIKDLIIHNLLYLANVPGYDNANPHINLRLLDSIVQTKTSESAYINFQRRLLQKNRLAVEYQVGKETVVKKGIKRHLEEFPEDQGIRLLNFRPAVLDPFSTGGKYSNKNILDRLLKKFLKEPSNIGLGLACIQMLMEKRNVDHAAQVVEQILASGVPRYPGLVAVAVQLYESQGRYKEAEMLLIESKA